MKPDVILAAKLAGVGQRGGGHQRGQIALAGLQAVDEQRLELVDGRLFHQRDQRFQLSERKRPGSLLGPSRRESQIRGHGATDTGQQHSPTDVREKTSACVVSHRSFSGESEEGSCVFGEPRALARG